MSNLYGYPEMYKVIPEGKSGKWSIFHHSFKTEDLLRIRNYIPKIYWVDGAFEPGTYCVLSNARGKIGEVMMSDMGFEIITNQDIIQKAKGDVLIAGLGIGLIPSIIIDSIDSLTIVEREPDVIKLVEKPLRNYLGEKSEKLTVVQSDIFQYTPTQLFDVIYFDIWQDISGDNYKEIEILHRKFRDYLKPDGWMSNWMRDEFQKLYENDVL